MIPKPDELVDKYLVYDTPSAAIWAYITAASQNPPYDDGDQLSAFTPCDFRHLVQRYRIGGWHLFAKKMVVRVFTNVTVREDEWFCHSALKAATKMWVFDAETFTMDDIADDLFVKILAEKNELGSALTLATEYFRGISDNPLVGKFRMPDLRAKP